MEPHGLGLTFPLTDFVSLSQLPNPSVPHFPRVSCGYCFVEHVLQ